MGHLAAAIDIVFARLGTTGEGDVWFAFILFETRLRVSPPSARQLSYDHLARSSATPPRPLAALAPLGVDPSAPSIHLSRGP